MFVCHSARPRRSPNKDWHGRRLVRWAEPCIQNRTFGEDALRRRRPSVRFALGLGFVAKPTRFPEIEKLPIAGGTMDYVLPLGILFNVHKSGRSKCEVSQDIRSGTVIPFGVGVRPLHRFLVFALQTIPLMFRCFTFHVCQSVIMA